jgi:hypothetical protein
VNVSPAHAGAAHADEHFIVANARLGDVLHHETWSGLFLHEGFQECSE